VLTKIFSYTDHFSDGVSTAEVRVMNETKKRYDLGGEEIDLDRKVIT
jgi:hypothetical protein